ncbi:stage II sporulation protein [Halomicronema hongdechloris C2206]|uniref:Stage II sporulation protein n=1 Tax=Halomicronema hongdechloris C2206 TaxID=1641165 RepID=A0A1Z3HIB3_9CYAN|nr:SpoIID/LytB domain-containing protein [Halomicronema hongdechloris]ASC70054.1 stage II sporulation protein [Halomicronema hongdechloris C2206]
MKAPRWTLRLPRPRPSLPRLPGARSVAAPELGWWSRASLRPLPLTFASGLLFTGVLAVQLGPLPERFSSGQSELFVSPLWQMTGDIRQSVTTLYRVQRQLQADETAASQAAAATTASSASAPPSSSSPSEGSASPAPVPRPTQATGETVDMSLEMRVAIARDVTALTVGASTTSALVDVSGQHHCEVPAQTSYVARPNGQGIDFGGCQLSTAVWLEPGNQGYVYIGDSWYRGRLLLLNRGGKLLAVNFVQLQDYLVSVVGSEMYPDWPLEALRAQAVAARSYALTHHVRPASRDYDLDNTQRFQAYKGIARETNTTHHAVTTTSGEFISYQGGIVRSLYAASDQIVARAHRGQGMSQTGAMELAAQGYTYLQILGNYYPNTSLARLVVN